VRQLQGFRVASWDTPLRVNPNRHAGRWNHAGAPATQYIALHPLGTWAEYLRWHGIRDAARARELRLGAWALRVFAEEVLAVGFENARELGLRAEDLVGGDWAPCQAAAERLRRDRARPKALEVPSAALPGARNLVILEPRVAAPYMLEPLDAVDTPVTLAAAGAHPPASLLELVCHRGEEHAELLAWRAGIPFRLVEPRDALLAGEGSHA
jgi:RES domain-containing protein